MMILNVSLIQEVLRNIRNLEKITPVFKSGARNKGNNHRPISVLRFSRLFEKVVHDQLLDFFLSTTK